MIIPDDIKELFQNVVIEQYWWDGVQINIPFHCVYAKLHFPIADHWKQINGVDVPIIKTDKYLIPIWDPINKTLSEMPEYAIVIIYHKRNNFGLYAYPADHIDEPIIIPYQEWEKHKKS